MAGPLADVFFFLAIGATAVAHWFILRSTIRGMRMAAAKGTRAHTFWEWTWAVLPALSLVLLFLWTWRVMHPDTMTFLVPPHAGPQS